jgi:hypothetical protein
MHRTTVWIPVVLLLIVAAPVIAAPTDRQMLDTRGHVVLPLRELILDADTHKVTMTVLLDGKELFHEEYSVRASRIAIALQLNLEGAGQTELEQIAKLANDRCAFRIDIDGLQFANLTASKLVELSRRARMARGAVLARVPAVASYPAPHISGLDSAPHPLPEGTLVVAPRPAASRSLESITANSHPHRKSSNDSFQCPSLATGGCSAWDNCSNGYCDPYDAGFDQCVAQCQAIFNSCAFGEPPTVNTNDWFEPQVYYGQVAGFYPWYCFITGCGDWLGSYVHIWEIWGGIHHHQTSTTYNCMLDGTFGPYINDSSYYDICYIKTSLRVPYGEYLGDGCRIE